MDFDTIPWILLILAWLFLIFKELRNYSWVRKHRTVICQYEWCTFAATSDRDQAELVYVAMNQHLSYEHGSGPWANGVLNSSD